MTQSRRTFLRSAGIAGAASAVWAPIPTQAQVSNALAGPSAADLKDRFDPWIEVKASAVVHNVSQVRSLTEQRPILAVIKNNAYGLDLITAARILEPMPEIHAFAVVKVGAAVALREAGITKPVHLMAAFPENLAADLAHLDIQPCLFTENAPRLTQIMAQAVGRPISAQVYLDTGMSRMGVPHDQALPWLEALVRDGHVRLQGAFMGFTEDPDYDREQLERFTTVSDAASERGISMGVLHAASSSAVFELPEAHLDMVRPGMALYGGYPNDPALQSEKARLQSAFSLKARVVRVQQLQAGDSVSYGRNYVAEKPTWVATVPVGHTDGYPRKAVSGGRILIGTETYPVIGAVSASHAIVEVGESPKVRVGDVATLLGSESPETDPNWLSATVGVSIYDIFMHLNPLLPRVVT